MGKHQTYRFPFASYPAVRLVLLMCIGITADYYYDFTSFGWVTACVLLAALYFGGETAYRRSLKSHAYNTAIFCYLGMIICFGGAWHSFFDYRDPPNEAEVINTYTWEELMFEGTIHQIKQTSTGKYQIDVAVDTTVFPGDRRWAQHYRIRAVLDPQEQPLPKHLKLGNRIGFEATVYPLEEKRNPSQFDYKQYLASQGIYSQVGIQRITSNIPTERILRWTYWRQQVLDAIDHNFSPETSSLAKALLIGYKNELDREEKIRFSRAGLSHIMAVSGLHVGFILAPFWIMIPLFWTMRYGKQIGLALLVGVLFIYAGLTDFSASVTRASLVGILLAYGKLFHKIRDSKNLTAVAALIILLINPSDLFSIGFQLSFGAVYIILLTAPVIQRSLPDWIRFRWYGVPVMVVVISLIVQVGLFPLLAYYFGEFSVAGPLANAFVIPVLGVVVPYALFLLIFTGPFPEITHLLNTPADIFLDWLNRFVEFTATLPWSWVQVHIDSILFFSIWISIIFLIAALPISRMRWKVLAVLLGLLCLQQAVHIIRQLQPAQLQITFFDVGQGDAALVTTPGNNHFLIDAGIWQPDYNSARYVILPHLKEHGIDKLDGIFLSHPHADHIGGTVELIESIPIDTIYNSGASYDSKLYKTYRQRAAEKQIPVVSLSSGDQVAVDPAVRLFVYGPASASEANVNNSSLVFELIYGQTEFLFLGDAERRQEQQLLQDFPELADTDFLKVAHHGSKTSSTSRLLQKTTPKMGVVSLAKRNRFSHPHKEAVRRLRKNIPGLHFTSLEGAVQFVSDGKEIYRSF